MPSGRSRTTIKVTEPKYLFTNNQICEKVPATLSENEQHGVRVTDPRAAVLCVGAITLDTIVRVDRVPDDDERVVADQTLTGCGGPAAVAAVALARLGVKVSFAATVGTDNAGDAVLQRLDAEGVNVDLVKRSHTQTTAVSVIILERHSAGRRIITSHQPSPPELAHETYDEFSWVHVDQTGWPEVRPHISRPRRGGWLLSVDAGNPIEGLDLADVDLFVPTMTALRASYGALDDTALLRAATEQGARVVVATDGARGAYVTGSLDESGGSTALRHVPAYRIRPVSTLGAGDVFHGGLLAGLVQSRGLDDAVRVAHAAAALSCRALDAQSGIPGLREVEQLMTASVGETQKTKEIHE